MNFNQCQALSAPRASCRRLILPAAIGLAIATLAPSVVSAAQITVNTTADITADDGVCSLRESIVSANGDVSSGSLIGECVAGSGADTIIFDAALNGQTISFENDPVLTYLSNPLPAIAAAVTLSGNGMSQTVISAGELADIGHSRIFIIDDGDDNQQIDVTISGMTLRNARMRYDEPDSYGGAVLNRENLNLQAVTVTDNFGQMGVGIANQVSGSLSILNSVVSNNSDGRGSYCGNGVGIHNRGELTIESSELSENFGCNRGGSLWNSGVATLIDVDISDTGVEELSGGAIYNGASGTVTMSNSRIANGRSYYGGGSIHSSGQLEIISSTIEGGGAANSFGTSVFSSGTLSITNSTISGASATAGAVYVSSGDATLTNVTIFNTTVASSGRAALNLPEAARVSNSLVAGTTGAADCVIEGAALTVNVGNLIQDGSCSPALTGDPLVGPLQDNGGPTPTHALLVDSPAINAADNVSCPTLDQRGVERVDGQCDIGAFEYLDVLSPSAVLLDAPDVNSQSTQYTFEVEFSDDTAIDISSLGGDDMQVAGGGSSVSAQLLSIDASTNGSPRLAVYRITPPSGDWAAAGNGLYNVVLNSDSVSDTSGNFVVAGTLGSFEVNLQPEIDLSGLGFSIESGDTSPSPQDGTDFGSPPIGTEVTRTFQIENLGGNVLALTGSPLVVVNGDGFVVSQEPTASEISPDGSVQFQVTFAASVPGSVTGEVSIANNDADEDPYVFAVSGGGVDVTPPAASLTSAPRIETETAAAQRIDVTFSDSSGVDVSSIGCEDLLVSTPNGGTLTCELAAVDENSDGSPRIATYVFPPPGDTWDAEDNGFYSVNLSANAVSDSVGNTTTAVSLGQFEVDVGSGAPDIEVSGSQPIANGDDTPSVAEGTDFGTLNAGQRESQTFTITNAGSSTLTLSGPNAVAISGAGFNVTSQPQSTLLASASVDFVVEFSAASSGERLADVSIASDDPDESPYEFRLRAFVNSAPRILNQSFSVDSSASAGTLVGQLTVTDAESDVVSFSVVSGNTDTAFEVSDSGAMTFTGFAGFFGERYIGVRVTDAGGLSHSNLVRIFVEADGVTEGGAQ